MLPPLGWSPSHALSWIPAAGGHPTSCAVRVIATRVDGRPALVAQTADEDRTGRPPRWVRFDGEGWRRWPNGPFPGGRPAVVLLERLRD